MTVTAVAILAVVIVGLAFLSGLYVGRMIERDRASRAREMLRAASTFTLPQNPITADEYAAAAVKPGLGDPHLGLHKRNSTAVEKPVEE